MLDQMSGSGTTLVECKLLGRNGIGIEINPEFVKLAKERLQFKFSHNGNSKVSIDVGDARNLKGIKDESIDLIATHPPYVDIIKYSEGKIAEDLSNIHSIKNFCDEIEKVAAECYRALNTDV